ncbi:MAG TPA: toll/interleukin-1 receptor domain-containing protein [Pseudonocardiaceae bacterium]|nr:toll/interleukin-1 receptor domain-containing protein [Pseudonocardiaceae bacterium]
MGWRPSRVFISYANVPGDAHAESVREFWTFLRTCGVDARLDLSAAAQRRDWALWMGDELRAADYVVVVASAAYRERAEGRGNPAVGRGVQWEARLIRDAYYRDQHSLGRVLPVVLPGQTVDGVPDFLTPATTTVYHVSAYTHDGAKPLLQLLTRQPEVIEPPIGPPPDLSTGVAVPGRARRRVAALASVAVLVLAAAGLWVALHGFGTPATGAVPPAARTTDPTTTTYATTTSQTPPATTITTHTHPPTTAANAADGGIEVAHTKLTVRDSENLKVLSGAEAGLPYVWYHSGMRSLDVDGHYPGGRVSVLSDGVTGTSQHCQDSKPNALDVSHLRVGQFVCVMGSDQLMLLQVLAPYSTPDELHLDVQEYTD